jgi:hypothetical protein
METAAETTMNKASAAKKSPFTLMKRERGVFPSNN